MMRGFTWLGSLPPLAISRALGRGLGAAFRALDKRHREIVRHNLAASFPDKDEAWVEQTSKAVFAHIGQVITEMPAMIHWPEEKFRERIRIHGLANV